MAAPRHPERGIPAVAVATIIARMTASDVEKLDVLVLGGGPAGVVAAVRPARLGARTALITRDALGGIAANDGPVPVRTLAHAARLVREARQLSPYGITAGEPRLDYAASAPRADRRGLTRARERRDARHESPRGRARLLSLNLTKLDSSPAGEALAAHRGMLA